MNSKTTSILKEIQKKVLSPATKKPEFRNTDEVIDAAVNEYYKPQDQTQYTKKMMSPS